MIIRLIIALALTICTLSCKAETETKTTTANVAAAKNHMSVENSITDFSKALANKDLALLLTITDPKAIYVVRSYTSGTLGGRGEPLSESFNPNKIDKELSIPIKKQTPFDLPGLFMEMPITSFGALPQHTLGVEIENTHYDQWAPILKKSLTGAAEMVKGDPLILSSANGKYWVYAEAQIIDDILAGSFAVFSPVGDKLKLVAVIELL